MQHQGQQENGHPRTQRIRAKVEHMTPPPHHPERERLTPSIELVNQLLNKPSHRPDAVRLLREILWERAVHQHIRNWDANSLFG